MGGLKPIGSEKLEGREKINRILEISRYKQSPSSQEKDLQTESYSIQLADGNIYKIIQERSGYIIKKLVNESLDYMEPMRNRKYFSSYSEAFKKLNLLAKEFNTLYENTEGVSLFGEQKKFTLKTPKPELPPAVETPPPSDPMMGGEEPVDLGMSPDGGIGEPEAPDMGEPEMGGDPASTDPMGEVSFKQIQKLTGKLGQKIREYKVSDEMSSKDIKYVVNSILSALDLTKLEDNDREEILSRFDPDNEMGNEDGMMDDTSGMDTAGEMGDPLADDMSGMDTESTPTEMGEDWEIDEMVGVDYKKEKETAFAKEIVDSIFGESKVEKILNKYFEKKPNENSFDKARKEKLTEVFNRKMDSVKKLCESKKQEARSKDFMLANPKFEFIGKTNKKNLVFEYQDKQVKITTEGILL